jgi:type I restriction enzyme S subunit
MSIKKDHYPEWLGILPDGWGLTDIGRIYEECKEKVLEDDYQPLSVTMNGIVPQLSSAVKAAEGSDRKLVRAGDFVINSRSDRRGACGVSPVDGSCSVINIVIHPHEGVNGQYFNYVLLSERFPDEFYRWGHGIASDLWTTRWSEMKKIQLPLPPDNIQKEIVKIIEDKCVEIDNMIDSTNASINEYKLLRQEIIENAITKGLDRHTKLKDSGDEAFGQIPSHWSMKKIKRIFAITKNIAGEEGHQVLSITQKGIVPKDISRNEGQMAADYSGYQFVNRGDFAMNHMDLLTGWVDISSYDGVTSPDYRVFVMKDEEKNCKRFYLYVMQMCYFKEIFYSLAQGVSEFGRCRLQADKFLHFEIMNPPYEEQYLIANYLDEKIGEVDSIINQKEKMVVELKEYKAAMIYEYVTGKKEVPQS